MSLGKNIKQYREALGLSKKALSDLTKGEVSPGAISVLEARDSDTSKFTAQLAQALGVSVEQLMLGVKGVDQNTRPAQIGLRRIPVLSKIPAGGAKQIVDAYLMGAGMEDIATDLELSTYSFALIIEGDSMEPEFKTGDKVIIDPQILPRPGDYVVAKCNGDEGTFKKFRPRGQINGVEVFELVPLNEDYPTIRSDSIECSVIGTMVEHRKYYRRR